MKTPPPTNAAHIDAHREYVSPSDLTAPLRPGDSVSPGVKSGAAPDVKYPQLDGVRAVAMCLVFYTHFAPARWRFEFPFGSAGVTLFFVLSGFLITGILIDARESIASGHQGLGYTLRQFYARRSLRIFPIYYLVLGLALLLGYQFNGYLRYHILYISSIYRVLFFEGEGFPGGHLWSLAVEEQFYVVWPLIVFCTPPRRFPWVLLGTVALAWAVRFGMVMDGRQFADLKMFTLTCLDALAIGAAVAVLVRGNARRFAWVAAGLAVVGLSALGAAQGFRLTGGLQSKAYLLMIHPSLAIVGAAIVARGVIGFPSIVGAFLTFPAVRHLGRISYCMYLVHEFVPWILQVHFPVIAQALGRHWTYQFVAYFAITVAFASLTWYVFERPINNLKRFFPMKRRGAVAWGVRTEHAAGLNDYVATPAIADGRGLVP
jgi:peptidoglycan/LPS O-acetylase OafA/YrhL